MGDEMLASVCELAFDVAKEGNAPSAMKNYLYLAQRPPRAYSVAQRALEEDTNFRSRVAERATIEGVGEAGYLWLHRPEGWEQRFSDLNAGVEPIDAASGVATPLAERPPMPSVPTNTDLPVDPATLKPTPATQIPRSSDAEAGGPPAAAEPPVESPRSAPTSRPTGAAPTVSSIENELSSLRGLVDRLADERQNVRSSVTELEVELETRRAENIEMFTKLSSLRNELTTVQSSESTILLDRDRALVRVTELEADVARLSAEVERMAAEAEGSSSEHAAALTDLAAVTSERDGMRTEVDSLKAERDTVVAEHDTVQGALTLALNDLSGMTSERDDSRVEVDSLKAESETREVELASVQSERDAALAQRDTVQGELDAVTTDRNGLAAQFAELRSEHDQLTHTQTASVIEIEAARSEGLQLKGQLESVTAEREEVQGLLAAGTAERGEMAARLEEMDQLTLDNAELRSRLSVAEQARVDLEGQLDEVSEKWKTATRQLSIFENVNSQLDDAVLERDELEGQLARTNDALVDLHRRIGTSHEQIRKELLTVESTFGDNPDALPVALADVTPADSPEAEVSPDVEVSPEVEASPEVEDDSTFMVPTFDATDAEVPDLPFRNATAPEVEIPDVELPDVGIPDLGAPDINASNIEAPDIQSFDAPSFGDSVDFGSPDGAADSIDGEDVFDGQGIELDPTTLGGRTIGDMFGGGDEAAEVDELSANDTSSPMDSPQLGDLVSNQDEFDGELQGAGRRRLSIPTDLTDAAFANAVVNSPDVILLIDGDGAASLGWPHLDVATRRGALVDYLGTLTAATGAAADVVFARPVGGEEALPVSRAVRVRIADVAVADSPIFSTIVEGYPEEWPIAIVSNEPPVLAQADILDVTVMTNDQLLDLFLDLNSES